MRIADEKVECHGDHLSLMMALNQDTLKSAHRRSQCQRWDPV